MVRLRKIRKWGNTHAVVLFKADLQDLGLKVGDHLDIEACIPNKEEELKALN